MSRLHFSRVAWSFLLLGMAAAMGAEAGEPKAAKVEVAKSPYEPTSRYETKSIEGWRVRVQRGLVRDEPELCQRALDLLRDQLKQIRRVVPAPAVEKLQKVTIWVERDEGHHPCMVYHPNRAWLVKNGMNPDKARCVEVANAERFLKWTLDQPWMVLHELAHAYHDQFLGGYGNPEIAGVYRSAMKNKLYDSVMRVCGRSVRAYAATNPMEYFAENSEALFGTNDFYPFVRGELKHHDPEGYRLLRGLWGVAKSR